MLPAEPEAWALIGTMNLGLSGYDWGVETPTPSMHTIPSRRCPFRWLIPLALFLFAFCLCSS
jgi:hypothetical protein